MCIKKVTLIFSFGTETYSCGPTRKTEYNLTYCKASHTGILTHWLFLVGMPLLCLSMCKISILIYSPNIENQQAFVQTPELGLLNS